MIKIAIIAPYVGITNRGAETFVIELTKELSKYFIVDVYSQAIEKSINNNIKIVTIKYGVIFKIHNYLYNNISIYRKITNNFYYLIPDVIIQKKFSRQAFKIINNIHYDLLFPNNGVWGAKHSNYYRELHGVPFIYTGHGGIGFGEEKILKTSPNIYISLTNKQLQWAKTKGNHTITKFITIPNGVKTNDFVLKTQKNKEKIILSVGALTEFKRHELTIMAVSKIPGVKLVIVGSGEEEKKLKELGNKYLAERIQILSLQYNEIKSYYSNADIFVLPSREEPFGIVYLEAMSSNLPIVAPNDNQRKEIIGNAGLFCNVENSDEYAQTIIKAMKQNWNNIPLKQAKKFDWSIISKEYKKIIENTIEEHSFDKYGKTKRY